MARENAYDNSRCSAVLVGKLTRAFAQLAPFRIACFDLDGNCIDLRVVETDVVTDDMTIRLPGIEPYRIPQRGGLQGALVLDGDDDVIAYIEASTQRLPKHVTLTFRPARDLIRIVF